ncbi:MAG: 4-aminobutyrate aminotransferase [Phycisphaerales bacterium]|jgi:4-aminobutyrate aminotransferase|nr:4-aminobutyrate aminotransferase [Phycisphaerales bacterium]
MLQSTMPSSKSRPVVQSPLGVAPSITTPLPGPRAKVLIERDEKYSSPSYTRDYPLVVGRALGSVVEDVDGNRFLDLAAGIAVCATGHCHPEVVATIERNARTLIHICGSDFYYPPMIDLMEKLSAITPGGDKKILLTNSGAEAVEAAFKLARHHTNRKYAISFHGAFHGRTMGALALTSSKARQKERFSPLVPMTAQVPYGDIAAIEATLFRYQMSPQEVAAVFVEALQGEGGYIVPPANFLPDLRKLCDKHGILLICDEIQSGVGRTGKWFAFEHFGITPDIVLMSKGIASGMPLGAVIASEGIMDWPEGAQGSTFGGNPICCAAAMKTLELVETKYMANAAKVGAFLLQRLKEIATRQKTLACARGLGLMCGVDVLDPVSGTPDPKRRNRIVIAAYEHGLIMLGCGEHTLRFCPALSITQEELDAALTLFEEAVASVG